MVPRQPETQPSATVCASFCPHSFRLTNSKRAVLDSLWIYQSIPFISHIGMAEIEIVSIYQSYSEWIFHSKWSRLVASCENSVTTAEHEMRSLQESVKN